MISQCDSTAPHGSHFRTSGDKVTLPPAPLHSHSTWKPLVASKDKRSSQIRKIRLISHKSSAKLLVPINNQPKRKSYAQVCLNGCHRSRWSVHAVRRMPYPVPRVGRCRTPVLHKKSMTQKLILTLFQRHIYLQTVASKWRVRK